MNSHPLYQKIRDTLENRFPVFKILSSKEQEKAFKTLEAEKMILTDGLELHYSRRPDLFNSYHESYQNPLIVVDDESTFIGVISEVKYFNKNNPFNAFYTSDLRLSPHASKKVKASFRPFYRSLIECAQSPCYTAVLDENKKAINALTKGKSGIYYHPFFSYYTISFPIFSKLKNYKRRDNIEIKKVESIPVEFIEKIRSDVDFSYEVRLGDLNYLIKKNDEVIGFYSFYRPQSRTIRVKAKRFYLKALMGLISLRTKYKYSQKIPWVYLTNSFLLPEYKDKNIFETLISNIVKDGDLSVGELILTAEYGDSLSKYDFKVPQVVNRGTVFEVSLREKPSEYVNSACINPLCL